MATTKSTKPRPPLVHAIDRTVWKIGIEIGSVEWFQWLLTIKSFSFVICPDRLTIRRNSKKPSHWYAFRKYRGKLISRYVGVDSQLTYGTLIDIARYMKMVIPNDL